MSMLLVCMSDVIISLKTELHLSGSVRYVFTHTHARTQLRLFHPSVHENIFALEIAILQSSGALITSV